MNDTYLNIIAFNVPYPANYGGVIDVFYKLKALHNCGLKIILHAFEYGRKQAPELEQYCDQVFYYKRKAGWLSQLSTKPYIVRSRRNKDLYTRLLSNDYPILFEGLHTCCYLNDPVFANRMKMVRTHNIEHDYYRGLARNASSVFLKAYFRYEAFRLEKYEKQLRHADRLLTLSTTDQTYFESLYGKDKTVYCPLFFQQEQSQRTDPDPFVLFHGDLSNWENINAALFLIRSVASMDDSVQWVFAGRNPHPSLLRSTESHENISVKGNLSELEMNRLLCEAKVNVLYTNQVSGVKLKLLNVLTKGWFCLATSEMLKGSGLEDLCELIESNDPSQILNAVKQCLAAPFPSAELEKRKDRFESIYNNNKNALKIKGNLRI